MLISAQHAACSAHAVHDALTDLIYVPSHVMAGAGSKASTATGQGSALGLRALLLTGTLDSAVRMGFLTFLPFLLQAKGAG